MSAANAAPSPGRSLRVLALVLSTQPVIVLVAILFVLPLSKGSLTAPVAALVVALVAAGFAAARTVGYRVGALPPGLDEDEARRRSLMAYQQAMIIRFVCTEAPIIVSLALSFVIDQGPWPLVLAVVLGVPSMLHHVLVRPHTVERVRAGLESGGARSYVDESLAV